MKKSQRNSFKLNPIAASIVLAMASQLPANVAYAGSGWGNGVSTANTPVNIQTYYANSPSGPAPALTAGAVTLDAVTNLPIQVDSGKALRKFVDPLPAISGVTSLSAIAATARTIPVAVPEKWVNLNGVTTGDDYYEIAAVEYTEQMHSDLVKPTHLRGYVQLMTPGLIAKGVTAVPFTTLDGRVLSVVAAPNHLGPIINATKGTAVRVKFINDLPLGAAGNLFLPVDTTITGAGLGPDGVNSYTQNRAEIHLVGGQAPWISAGSPHQWVAPAGETTPYTKGASTQNVPDMADPGAGATTLYFPNDMSARFTLYEDRSAGITRLNTYAGLEAGYFVTDPVEQALAKAGTIPADQIPLIIEDKTFVPSDIAQQDALWDTAHWGQPGDLWFPHVYEANQGTGIASGVNPVGRWDFGPNFWPIFAASQPLPTGGYGNATFVPEAYMDTPVVNGVAYPTVTVDPKAYRFRILNASNDRFINLGLYKAAPDFIDTVTKLPTATASATTVPIAPQLDQNGNPVIDATGKPLYFSGSEVRLLPAVAVDAAGTPATPSPSTAVGSKEIPYDPTCLCQYPALPQLLTYAFSGPTRAWPVDSRMVPDPASVGPDFIAIGNEAGLLPAPVDIPSQPITYEANRRSVTVTNVYGYGLLVGPQERADAVVDFSPYAGQTLILYNDAPTPFPFDDNRVDYFTGDPDQTGTGGAYSTKPGYGPNTRTVMQIVVRGPSSTPVGVPATKFNVTNLAAALPAAYAASQPMPLVPQTAYNAAFGTTDTDNYGRVATGSAAQPTLDFVRSALVTGQPMTITGINIVSSTGPGSGSGTGYMAPPLVSVVGGLGIGGVAATAHSTINAAKQVATVVLDTAGFGYVSQPSVVFTPTGAVNTIVIADGGSGYTAPPVISITGGGATTNATATATVTTGGSPVLSTATVSAGGSGYAAAPSVAITGGGGSGATATATVSTSPIAAAASVTAGGSGFSLTPTVTFTGGNGSGAAATVTAAYAISRTIAFTGGTVAYDPLSTTVTISAPTTPGATATATATVDQVLGSPTIGQIIGVTVTSPGSGYTSAPTVSITDGSGNLTPTATATATLAAGTGVVTGLTVTSQGTGYTSAPAINFVDATGTGAAATATLAGTAGVVTAVNITNAGKGYTTAPTITITDPNGKAAVATVGLVTPVGTITGITITNPGVGYTSAPTVTITPAVGDTTGTGATANATILAAGTGAQATIVSTNTGSIVTLTKAEQELFDAQGRYNSTGGSELPYTTASIQTTVPLQYVDTPTEIIGDNESQVWKIVDNGFWSNSIHFDMNDVQLINRVGWDGTVKAPANNEVGWKDTVRLNPLEDVIVALRAKQATVPFGQPQSTRLQDPTLPAAAAGVALAAGLPAPARFTADPNVVSPSGLMQPANIQLLTTAVNSAVVNGSLSVATSTAGVGNGNFDNEFTWGTAVLGHAEDDFQRPVVFNPNVVIPDAPSALADTTSAAAPAGTLTLSWTDPTPPGQLASAAGVVPVLAATAANPKNELGFKIMRADVLNGAPTGAFVQVATVPANSTSWATTAAALAALTPPVNPAGAFEVVAYNVAGTSAPSNVFIEGIPVAPTALTLTPGFITPATNTSDVNVTATWQDNSNNETSYVTTRSLMVGGVVSGTPVVTTLPANTAPPSTTTWVDAGLLVEASVYKYDVVAKNNLGSSTPVLTGTITAPISVPLAPAPLNAAIVTAVPNTKAANVALSWTDNAFNETGYTVSRIGNGAFTTVILPANSTGYVDTTTQEGQTYTYNVCATNLSIAGVAQAGCTSVGVTNPITIPLQPTDLTATAVTAPLDSNGLYPDAVTLKWTDKAFNETGYQVLRGGVVIGTVVTSAAAGTAMTYTDPTPAPSSLLDGHAYSYTVAAVNSVNPLAPATVATATSNAAALTMPGLALPAPTAVVATPNRNGAFIGLTWVNPASTTALPITGVLIQESINNGAWVNATPILPAGTTTFRRAAAVVGNVYNFRIAEVNVAQKSDSAYTYINATLTSPTAPAVPVLANLAPVPNVTNGSVALSWAAIAPITGTTMSYRVNITVNGVTTTIVTNRTNYTFRPTAAQVGTGATFSFTVQSVQTAIVATGATLFGSATSLPSAPATVVLAPAVAPAALASVTATVASATQATLTWTDNSTVETSYLVTILNTTTGTTTTATINRTAAQTTGSGTAVTYNAAIVAGNSYKFTVVAQNTKYGVTVASPAVSTTLTVPTVPAAPTAVSVTQGAAGSRAITVTWADAATNVTNYTIQRATVTGGVVGAYANVGTATTKTFTNTGLVVGTTYSYQVRANSLVGNSAFVVMGQATAR